MIPVLVMIMFGTVGYTEFNIGDCFGACAEHPKFTIWGTACTVVRVCVCGFFFF